MALVDFQAKRKPLPIGRGFLFLGSLSNLQSDIFEAKQALLLAAAGALQVANLQELKGGQTCDNGALQVANLQEPRIDALRNLYCGSMKQYKIRIAHFVLSATTIFVFFIL
jgi:hypothetical protein